VTWLLRTLRRFGTDGDLEYIGLSFWLFVGFCALVVFFDVW